MPEERQRPMVVADTLEDTADVATGVFAGPICGLKYQTPTMTGLTNARGEFRYRTTEAVTFLVGGVVLGTTKGAPRVNLAQLVNRVAGKIDKLHDPLVTNLARLVQTLDQDGDVESGVTIAPVVHQLLERTVLNFNQTTGDRDEAAEVVGEGEAKAGAGSFAHDPAVVALLETLNAAPDVFTAKKPRRLRSAAAARNELRRNIRGIVKMTDVKIP